MCASRGVGQTADRGRHRRSSMLFVKLSVSRLLQTCLPDPGLFVFILCTTLVSELESFKKNCWPRPSLSHFSYKTSSRSALSSNKCSTRSRPDGVNPSSDPQTHIAFDDSTAPVIVRYCAADVKQHATGIPCPWRAVLNTNRYDVRKSRWKSLSRTSNIRWIRKFWFNMIHLWWLIWRSENLL